MNLLLRPSQLYQNYLFFEKKQGKNVVFFKLLYNVFTIFLDTPRPLGRISKASLALKDVWKHILVLGNHLLVIQVYRELP